MSSKQEKSMLAYVLEGLAATAEFERAKESLPRDRYTIKQAAAVLGCHEKTVREWIKQGKLKARRPTPRKTYISREQLAAFLLRREENS